MASLNPSSDISAFVNPIFEGARLILREQNIMTKLVRVFNDRTGRALRHNSAYGGVTMGTIAETDDLVSQAFTPTNNATLTPGEIGAQYFLTDYRMESDPFPVKQDASRDLGLGGAKKVDTDLLGLFSTFTGGTVGTAGSAITWGHVFAGAAQLNQQLAPWPYTFVCNPQQWQPLMKSASVAGSATNAADSLKEAANSSFYLRTVSGISLFSTANLATSATCHAGLFSRDAIAFDLRRAPRLEPERDTSRRGWELNFTSVYAYGLWEPTFGIDMVFDGRIVTE